MAAHHAYLRLLMSLAGPRGDEFDVVHNHALHHLPVAMSPLLAPPMLTTLHTPPTPWLESAIELTRGDSGRGEFAAVSRFVARQWRVLRPDDEAHVVPNGVDLGTWHAGAGGRRARLVGRLVPEKAPHLAIEAARLAGMPLVLAGPIADPEYFDAMVRPRLGPQISYAGHLATPDLVDAHRVVGGRARDAGLGRALRPRRRGGARVRHAGRRLRPRRHTGGAPRPWSTSCPGSRSAVGRLVRPGDVPALAAAAVEAVRPRPHASCGATPVEHLSLDRMVTAYELLYDLLQSGATWESGQPA